MDLFSFLPEIVQYIKQAEWSVVPGWQACQSWEVQPLAQGEYNMNYLVIQAHNRWVLRVNLGSQIDREDQIEFKFMMFHCATIFC